MPHVMLLLRGFAADGPGRLVLQTLGALDPAAVRVSIVALDRDGPLAAPLEREVARLGGRLHRLPTGWLGVWATARRVAALVRSERADVLHAHLLRPDVVGRAAARSARVPYLVSEHGLHAWSEGPPVLRPVVAAWYRRSLPRGGKILAISEKVRDDLACEGMRSAQVVVVPNGINVQQFAPVSAEQRKAARAELGLPTGAWPVVLVLGSLIPRKAPRLVLRAVASIVERDPKWHGMLLYAGDGPRRALLEREIVSRSLQSRVRMLGQLPDPRVAIAAADILVHPAHDEPYGLVVAEALASGLPVITRHAAGADAVAPPPPLSLAITDTHPAAWGLAIQTLADTLGAREMAVREACRAHAVAHHDIRITARRLEEIYEAAVKTGP